jgi:hypothetical protein
MKRCISKEAYSKSRGRAAQMYGFSVGMGRRIGEACAPESPMGFFFAPVQAFNQSSE